MPRNASLEECSIHAPTDECGEDRRNSDHGHEVISQTKTFFNEAVDHKLKKSHRHSSKDENFKSIHFLKNETGEMISGSRASKGAIILEKNVSSKNFGISIDEEVKKSSIS